jgi:ribonuclease R
MGSIVLNKKQQRFIMSRKTSSYVENKPRKKELITSVTRFLSENNDKQYNYKQIAAALNVSGEEGRRQLLKVLDKLRDDDVLLESSAAGTASTTVV